MSIAAYAAPPGQPTGYEQYEKQYGGLGHTLALPPAVTALGPNVDSIYLAANAMLRYQAQQNYADILQQLGYTNDQGQFVMGDVESQGIHDKQVADYNRLQAIQDTTNAMQNAGTLFSGYRGYAQARAEHPYVQQIADIDVSVPKQLASLYEKASGVITNYTLQDQQNLADAAARIAAGMTGRGGAGGTGTSTPTGTTTPTTDPAMQPTDPTTGYILPYDVGGTQQMPGSPLTFNPSPYSIPNTPVGTFAPTTANTVNTYDVGGKTASPTNPNPWTKALT